MSDFYGFYLDLSRCIGCHTCVVACRDWNQLSESPSWLTVLTLEEGTFPEPKVTHIPLPCFHCEKPACLEVCPVSAYGKCPETGRVILDANRCIGCRKCKSACPYAVPQWNTATEKMGKCDLCGSRLQDEKPPICVAACPMRALDAGPLSQLQERYPGTDWLPAQPGPEETRPQLWVKQKD